MDNSASVVAGHWTMADFYPKAAWARSVVRLPLLTWRLGLGPIIGKWLMVLTTRGRKSGLPRHVMVEYHVMNGRKYAPSGFGAMAQYYQNIMADPHVTIQTASGTERARAVRVTDGAELLALFELMKQEDPPFLVDSYLKSIGMDPATGNLLDYKDDIYVLRFEPTDEVTPAGLEVDLAWLWPAALIGLLSLRLVQALSSRK
jgi:deazaflavin-dependent oxidoreductase (nitroreductase family)